jgi:flagellar basal-body rod protein FlgG
VLGMGDGYRMIPPIKLPPTATDISIGLDGTIQYTPAGTNRKQIAGQLKLTQFPNPQGLKLLGGSIYGTTDASGPPSTSFPGQNGAGQTLGTFLESSNVDPVKELVTLIKTQRSFELNSQSIQTANQALQVIGNLRIQ